MLYVFHYLQAIARETATVSVPSNKDKSIGSLSQDSKLPEARAALFSNRDAIVSTYNGDSRARSINYSPVSLLTSILQPILLTYLLQQQQQQLIQQQLIRQEIFRQQYAAQTPAGNNRLGRPDLGNTLPVGGLYPFSNNVGFRSSNVIRNPFSPLRIGDQSFRNLLGYSRFGKSLPLAGDTMNPFSFGNDGTATFSRASLFEDPIDSNIFPPQNGDFNLVNTRNQENSLYNRRASTIPATEDTLSAFYRRLPLAAESENTIEQPFGVLPYNNIETFTGGDLRKRYPKLDYGTTTSVTSDFTRDDADHLLAALFYATDVNATGERGQLDSAVKRRSNI